LIGANLAGAALAGSDVTATDVIGADLVSADLVSADLVSADWARARAILSRIALSPAICHGVDTNSPMPSTAIAAARNPAAKRDGVSMRAQLMSRSGSLGTSARSSLSVARCLGLREGAACDIGGATAFNAAA
jgi:uncharacterized protein YjbI with pentapeptide repeats